MLRYIEGYVQKVSPAKAPAVVGALLDCEAPDEFINNLILSVRSLLPVDGLVEAVERRNRLKLLTPFLEHLISEGSQDPHVHNALGERMLDSGPPGLYRMEWRGWEGAVWGSESLEAKNKKLLSGCECVPVHGVEARMFSWAAFLVSPRRQDHHRHQQQPRALPHHQPLLRLAGGRQVSRQVWQHQLLGIPYVKRTACQGERDVFLAPTRSSQHPHHRSNNRCLPWFAA